MVCLVGRGNDSLSAFAYFCLLAPARADYSLTGHTHVGKALHPRNIVPNHDWGSSSDDCRQNQVMVAVGGNLLDQVVVHMQGVKQKRGVLRPKSGCIVCTHS